MNIVKLAILTYGVEHLGALNDDDINPPLSMDEREFSSTLGSLDYMCCHWKIAMQGQ